MAISILSIFIATGGLFSFIFITKANTVIDEDKFSKIMTNNGLEIYDATSQFGENYVKSASVAYNKSANYQIEFIIFSDSESSKNAFNLNKTTFKRVKGNQDEEISKSNDKTSKYILTTSDRYMYISRKENTLLYLSVDGSYKQEISNLVKKLGY